MTRIGFFATRPDLVNLLTALESSHPICYVEAGMFDEERIVIYQNALQIPGLSEIDVLDPNQGRAFLIADSDGKLTMRAVPQRRGGIRYAMDQRENPNTISLLPGGRFDGRTVVVGNFGTCTESTCSRDLMSRIQRIIKRQWTKIKLDFVGPEAESILDAGGRLTAGLRPEYDLRR